MDCFLYSRTDFNSVFIHIMPPFYCQYNYILKLQDYQASDRELPGKHGACHQEYRRTKRPHTFDMFYNTWTQSLSFFCRNQLL